MSLKALFDWISNPEFYFSPEVNWNGFINSNNDRDIQYPNPSDILYSIPVAFAVTLIRFLFHRCVYTGCSPIEQPKQLMNKSTTADNFKTAQQTKTDLANEIKQLENRQKQRWMRKSLKQSKITKKISETGWGFLIHFVCTIGTFFVLWDKSWLWDVNQCWTEFPYQTVPDDIWWLIIIYTGINLSALMTLAFQVKRKDFWAMAFHHVITLLLLIFSWIANLVRIATLIILVHDCSDILLQGAKLCKYLKLNTLANVTFGVFIPLWLITRLYIFPCYLIKSGFEYPSTPAKNFFMLKALKGMLMFLLFLHIYWTYFLFVALFKIATTGIVKDVRSSDESAEEDTNLSSQNATLKKTT